MHSFGFYNIDGFIGRRGLKTENHPIITHMINALKVVIDSKSTISSCTALPVYNVVSDDLLLNPVCN